MSGSLWARLFGRDTPRALPRPAAPPVVADVSPQPDAAAVRPVDVFHVRTARGLWVDLSGPQPVGTQTLDPAHALLLLRAEGLPNACVLLAPDNRVFDVPPDPWRAAATSARLLQTNVPGTVRLKYPVDGASFLTVGPAPATGLRFDGGGTTMDAAFSLVPVPAGQLSAWVREAAAELGTAVASGLRGGPLVQALRRGLLRPELAAALLRLMDEAELEALGKTMLGQPGQLAVVRLAMPGDEWLDRHIPALAAWEAAGRPAVSGHSILSPAADEAPLLSLERGRAPLGLALTALARRQTLPRKLACVLATARNEGPYLLDWVSYHLSIGFEHIFLYTNENQDESGPLLKALARHGVITLVENARGPEMGPQSKAYGHALTMLPQILDYRWTAILDIDEYLAFDTALFGGVADLIGLQECQTCDAIALSWLMFAALPHEVWSDASTPARFTRRERAANKHVKTLFRTRLFWKAQPHFPSASMGQPFVYRTQDGRAHHNPGMQGLTAAFAEHPGADQAWINHYFLRTADEALWKWSRGRADWPAGPQDARRDEFLTLIVEEFFKLGRPEHLVEDRRILACAQQHAAVLDRLLSLPDVGEADRAAKAGFGARLKRNTAAFLGTPLPHDAPETWRLFRDVLASVHV